jgi:hypothetical protein
MAWYDGRPRLKMIGHTSADAVEAIFASSMVDVAYVVETTNDALYIVADDPKWPANPAEYEWLCSVIQETLGDHGIGRIHLSVE